MINITRILVVMGMTLIMSSVVSAHTVTIIVKNSELLSKGRELIQVGNTSLAREHFLEAIERDLTPGQLARAHNGVCVSYIMEENWSLALQHCNEAIRLVPNNWRYYNNRGNIYLESGDIDRAIEEYNRGLTMAPNSLTIRGNLEIAEVRASNPTYYQPTQTQPT